MAKLTRAEAEEMDARSQGLTVHSPADALDDPDHIDTLDPAVIAAFEMAKKAETLQAELIALKTQLKAHQEKEALQPKLARCTPTIISSRDTHPNDSFDLCAGYSPHQLLASLSATLGQTDQRFPEGCLVLVPVWLYPTAHQDPQKPWVTKLNTATGRREPMLDRSTNKKIPNLLLGQTQIRESYLVVEADKDNTPQLFSIQAFCSLSVNPFGTPDQVHRRLENAQQKLAFQSNGADSHWDPEDDGDSTSDHRTPFAPNAPHSESTAFVPSLTGRDNAPNIDVDPRGTSHRSRRRSLAQ